MNRDSKNNGPTSDINIGLLAANLGLVAPLTWMAFLLRQS